MPNVTYEQLVDLAEGRLPAVEAAHLRSRVAAVPSAAAELAALETIIDLMRSDDSRDAPDHVISRALRLIRRPAPAPQPGLIQRIVAMLQSDSRAQPLAAGLRSGQAAVRSLVYNAEDWDVDLQLTAHSGRWQLRGQLFGPDLAGSVALSGGPAPVAAPINDLGEFTLPPVAAGRYRLLIQIGAREILVDPLELEPLTPSS